MGRGFTPYHHVCYSDGMHRIQIQLTAEQERALREMGRLRNASISALVREGVDALLEPARERAEERQSRALALIGVLGADQPRDLGERHDGYLARAAQERRPA